jgi:hypothetical protein
LHPTRKITRNKTGIIIWTKEWRNEFGFNDLTYFIVKFLVPIFNSYRH